ncbi:uncharacterized protein LOC144860761 isoform X2 [Branchiostoma floridae x Branchiostoma japonicum]
MAVVVENDWGWFLNQKVAIEKYCETVSDGDAERSYSCKEELFAITQPHITAHHGGSLTQPHITAHHGGSLTQPHITAHHGGSLTQPHITAHPGGNLTQPHITAHPGGSLTQPHITAHHGGSLTQPHITAHPGGSLTQPHITAHHGGSLTQPHITAHPGESLTQLHITAHHGGNLTQPHITAHQGGSLTQPHITAHHGGSLTQPHITAHPGGSLTQPHITAHHGGSLTQPHITAHPGESLTQPHITAHHGGNLTQPHITAHQGGSLTQPHITAHHGGNLTQPHITAHQGGSLTQPHITAHHGGSHADHVQTGLEAVAMGTNASANGYQDRKSRKRKRKRTSDLNTGEVAAMEYHIQIRTKLVQAHTAILLTGRASGLFQDIPSDVGPVGKPFQDWGPGNCLADLCDLARITGDEKPLYISQGTPLEESRDIFNRLVLIDSNQAIIKCLLGSRYLLPPRSSFLMSDITRMEPLLQGGLKYHLIVMDPPWENKSVKRGKKYESLSPWQLFQLPIPSLAAPGCLVVTWVTNRQQHMRFVRERLYPHWSVEPVAEWHWLKVTRTGEPVFPMDSPHKKPYETIILGRFQDQSDGPTETSSPPLSDVPRHKVICSVPCAIHSRKPPLEEVLRKYLPPSPVCLELFARCLLPRWTSWGNEPLEEPEEQWLLRLSNDGRDCIHFKVSCDWSWFHIQGHQIPALRLLQ